MVIGYTQAGFALSQKALQYIKQKKGGMYIAGTEDRCDPVLVECVEELGREAADGEAQLCVLEYDENAYQARLGQTEYGEEFIQLAPKSLGEKLMEKYTAAVQQLYRNTIKLV